MASTSDGRVSFDADVLILGGGCAGLSLGVRLAARAMPRGRALILEQREAYTNDRTWCFWRGAAHPFQHLITRSWHRMRVQSRPAQVVVDCGMMPYQLLPAGAFYDCARARIAAARGTSLMCGVTIRGDPVRISGGWKLETGVGSVTARQIIDTRPPDVVNSTDALLWQSFLGHEIECASGVFDPSTVELMDFDASSDGGIAFTYVLPLSPTRALIEYTVFGRYPRSAASLDSAQRLALESACRGSPYSVLRQECGVLPMGLMAASTPGVFDYQRVGLMSGAGRASTGYAFQRIQRWAQTAAASLRRQAFDVGHVPDPWHRRAMDRLFLQVLRSDPGRAPGLFLSMFRDADTSRVIRFLSDRGTALDCAAIITSLPVGLFLRQLARTGTAGMPVLRGRT